jgi:lipopolysaccharide biosynthesis glycosyltransferase
MQIASSSQERSLVSSSEKTVVVVCAADDRYSMPLAVVARSALENLDRDYKMQLFVIDGGITEANKAKIARSLDVNRCKVEFVLKPNAQLKLLEDAFQDLRDRATVETRHILSMSAATYYRLFIPELLPEQLDRAIYLDCDLVVKSNLKELWETDFQSNSVLAVQDIWSPYISCPNTEVPYQELGIPATAKYFNGGVLVINLKKWRDEAIGSKAIEHLIRYGGCPRTHDQGLLNAVLAEQWGELDPQWNLTPAIIDMFPSWKESPFSKEEYHRLIDSPSIIHFATNRKPWNSRHTLFKEAFFEYVDKTAWSGWRLTFWRRLKLSMTHKYERFLSRSK